MRTFQLHKWLRTPKSKSEWKKIGYCCVRLLLYANAQDINELKHFIYILYGSKKKFDMALSASTMTQWHHFDSTSDSEPQNLSQEVCGCNCVRRQLPYRVHLDSISMCSNTLYISNMDAVSSLRCGCQSQPQRKTSFWLHMWPKTQKSSVGVTV